MHKLEGRLSGREWIGSVAFWDDRGMNKVILDMPSFFRSIVNRATAEAKIGAGVGAQRGILSDLRSRGVDIKTPIIEAAEKEMEGSPRPFDVILALVDLIEWMAFDISYELSERSRRQREGQPT